ncbi:MAG: BMP family ABC transporter substrate-binding protein [Clostridia bacterium]|nr:BMP family ABC transporter substrate-binding protein [Clostridia bacterium]
MKRTMPAVLLVLAILCGCCGCGQGENPRKHGVEELKIGALFSDTAGATGISYYHLLGLQRAAKAMKLPDPLCKYSVTDVSFDDSEPITATTAKPTEAARESEPESYTTEDGEVIVRAVPIDEKENESAVSAAADLIGQGCSVIVATDPIYDDLTAFLAQNFKKVTFLQYRGTHTDLKNLQSYSDNLYEAFYLAGAVAGCEGAKQIGFTARKGERDEADCINAFALGVAKNNPDAVINLRMTHVDFDLYQERTVPMELIEKDKCTLLAQSVFTALPVTVAAGAEAKKGRDPLPCFGFGYDMQADGGERYLGSVVFDFSIYYTEALTALSDGSFSAEPYVGGVKQGVVRLTTLQHASEKTKSEMQTLVLAFKKDALHPLEGFKPEKNGYAANITVR